MVAEEQSRPDVALLREHWKAGQGELSRARLLFVDETGARTDLTRRYGRSPIGERARDSAPQGHWNTTTLLSAMGAEGAVAPLLLDGPIDQEAFVAWIEQFLAPCLQEGDVVVMDNLSAHKAAAVAEMIGRRGARLLYLPPYSPDLNPIEKMWSKIKALLRGAKARTREALQHAVAQALSAVSTNDIVGWFKSCGYTI